MTTERLATYGALTPGGENHWVVRNIGGDWLDGAVLGWTYPIGFGPADGDPGITLDPAGVSVPVAVLVSDHLDKHWREIDDFEGPGYRRVECDVIIDSGEQVRAWIYETDPDAE